MSSIYRLQKIKIASNLPEENSNDSDSGICGVVKEKTKKKRKRMEDEVCDHEDNLVNKKKKKSKKSSIEVFDEVKVDDEVKIEKKKPKKNKKKVKENEKELEKEIKVKDTSSEVDTHASNFNDNVSNSFEFKENISFNEKSSKEKKVKVNKASIKLPELTNNIEETNEVKDDNVISDKISSNDEINSLPENDMQGFSVDDANPSIVKVKRKRRRKHNKKKKNELKKLQNSLNNDIDHKFVKERIPYCKEFRTKTKPCENKKIVFNSSSSEDESYKPDFNQPTKNENQLSSLWDIKDEKVAKDIVMDRYICDLNSKTIADIPVIENGKKNTFLNKFEELEKNFESNESLVDFSKFDELLKLVDKDDVTVFKQVKPKKKENYVKIEPKECDTRRGPPCDAKERSFFIDKNDSNTFDSLLTMEHCSDPVVFEYKSNFKDIEIESERNDDLPVENHRNGDCNSLNENPEVDGTTSENQEKVILCKPRKHKSQPRAFGSLGKFLSRLKHTKKLNGSSSPITVNNDNGLDQNSSKNSTPKVEMHREKQQNLDNDSINGDASELDSDEDEDEAENKKLFTYINSSGNIILKSNLLTKESETDSEDSLMSPKENKSTTQSSEKSSPTSTESITDYENVS